MMRTEVTTGSRRTVARPLATEDIRRGQFVCLLAEVDEFLPCIYLHEEPGLRKVELLRVQSLPCGEAQPLKVVAVCLPFVLAAKPDGAARTFDVRRHRLARVTAEFAEAAFRLAKGKRKRKKRAARTDGDNDD